MFCVNNNTSRNIIKHNVFNAITAYTQQIIINSSEELLKDPFLPLAERIKKRTETLYHKEESLRGFIKSSSDDTSQVTFIFFSAVARRMRTLNVPRVFHRSKHKYKRTGNWWSGTSTRFTRSS